MVDSRTESEVVDDRGSVEVSLREPLRWLPTGKLQTVVCMLRRDRRRVEGVQRAVDWGDIVASFQRVLYQPLRTRPDVSRKKTARVLEDNGFA